MGAVLQSKMTLLDHLNWENQQDEKHQSWAGETVARVGARRGHGRAFRPGSDGSWDLHDHSESDPLEIASIDCRVPLAGVWQGVDPAPAD